MYKLFALSLLALVAFISTPCFSQISVNEYSVSNLEDFEDNYGRFEDWIELYNNSTEPVDIGGWYLSDKENKPTKWRIPDGSIINGNAHLVFWCSGRDTLVQENFHTNFKLSQTKGTDMILLVNPEMEVVEMHALDLTLLGHSRSRMQDGDSNWRICTEPTPGASNDSSPQFLRYTETPEIELEAGFYNGTRVVHINNVDDEATLHYTLDGTNPSAFSQLYSGPIIVDATTVVKAAAFPTNDELLPGKMAFATYFIDETFSLPVFSVAANTVIELANGTGELIPIGSLEYFDKEGTLQAVAFGSLNRHGQDSWVLPHRSLDYFCRDEMGYEKAVNYPMFSYSERDEYQKFMFRNSGDDNYPADDEPSHIGSTHIRDEYVQELSRTGDMKLDTRAVERVILFLNGQYWGVYGMRERPVDHDYTKEYYDQGKYDIHYLSTWGTTEAEYGGLAAFTDWFEIRDFILENDMSIEENYDYARSRLRMISLSDYMLANLNTVAADWLNYNTGWWRGLDPEGDHKKWGYILWDLDATFDYYINYTNIPNRGPDALPCDIEDISDFMDAFFSDSDTEAEDCETFLNGSSPYPAEDPIYAAVIAEDDYCCDTDWDSVCQAIYDDYLDNGGVVETEDCPAVVDGSCPYTPGDAALEVVMQMQPSCCSEWVPECQDRYHLLNTQWEGIFEGNIGKHEKIFTKLLEENMTFRQLFFSRQADLMNTVYSCENMIELLDEMLAVIEPEMPRQIERWGGTMAEWQSNVEDLKDFILARCDFIDQGMIECYALEGPYELTIRMEPEGVGEVELNTISILESPWTGEYFGNMDNLLEAKVLDEFANQYVFVGWQLESGSEFLPDLSSPTASFRLDEPEVITAVFEATLTTNETLAENHGIIAYPNPVQDQLFVNFELAEPARVEFELRDLSGRILATFERETSDRQAGNQHFRLDISSANLPQGMYILCLRIDEHEQMLKLAIK